MVLGGDLCTQALQLRLITHLQSLTANEIKLSWQQGKEPNIKSNNAEDIMVASPHIFKLFDVVECENVSVLQVLLRVQGLAHQTLPKRAK